MQDLPATLLVSISLLLHKEGLFIQEYTKSLSLQESDSKKMALVSLTFVLSAGILFGS